MAMLKEERKALRDELERVYGIHLREDDEFLPVIHFIHEASKLADLNNAESKKILEEMKTTSGKVYSDSLEQLKTMYLQASKNLLAINENARKELTGLPQLVADLKKSVASVPRIPEEVRINQVRTFETNTMSFLWRYFVVSFICVLAAVAAAGYLWTENKQIKEDFRPAQNKWLIKYYHYMEENAPNTHKKFILENQMPDN
jgi:hypothetical protein